jgi:hypothetical protein
MYLHQINRRIVDLRHSILDESELDALNEKKAELEKSTAKGKQAELFKIDEEIKKQKQIYSEERRAGRYAFKKKVYIDYDGNRRPPYHFTWCRYSASNNYEDLSAWQAQYGYTPVIHGKDQFWPESVYVNASNYYQFGDLVWVKCPLKDYLLRREEERKLMERGQKKIDAVDSMLDKYGASVPKNLVSQLRTS